ncbi:uncharacterized protein FIBRA_07286 [Fibroporia radiculosa]|uniref:Spermatogenesis-associated protein 20-like TRX domain-containing protein n=1 Tax=Fibroporia radiculosa TaxID=599839 RepID=J4H4J0_9APHY|nr:uncharacterized protein FIBRA_07286 [Fibroporia radiculosa]CCM05079.1 predicted protein [Fibroporia radiculosa]
MSVHTLIQRSEKPSHLNRLSHAKSPYLLQHAENPVDWYEWGPEAFEKARQEDKPIFLSVGYSACHWCHVLAHESFEDKVTANLMNEHYINIKVDREERPDVDRLYMTFLQASSGGGGWPMSIWLTPELHPFFAGPSLPVPQTYFPPGRFRQVLYKLADIWESDPDRCRASGKQIIESLRDATNVKSGTDELPVVSLALTVYARLAKRFDTRYGGFSSAPKFPQPSQTTQFLARYAALRMHSKDSGAGEQKNADEVLKHLDAESLGEDGKDSKLSEPSSKPKSKQEEAEHARDMAAETLVQIYKGGIHDVVEGGFARYSVDERWHVPHFEKMLYDQAQLLTSALELASLLPHSSDGPPLSSTRTTLLALARSILIYLPRHLTSPEGGFYSAEDADSLPAADSTKTKEGAFYTWTANQFSRILGEDAEVAVWAYGVKEDGNCDPMHDIQGELKGQNVLFMAHTPEEAAEKFGRPVEEVRCALQHSLDKLRAFRDENRPRPHLDDKILTCWNGLMISGLARATETFEGEEAVQALTLAERSAAFLRAQLYNEASGELTRSWREGAGPKGQADDYAFLIQGLLDLYEACGKEEYVIWAIRLQEKQDELFFDAEGCGYFASAPDEHILIRMKDAQDGAEPSAVSVTLSNLLRLSHFAEDRHKEYDEKAKSILASNAQLLGAAPYALAAMVSAAMCREKGYKQIILTESPASFPSPYLKAIRERFVPNRVLIHLDPANPPRKLAKVNGTLRSLLTDINTDRSGNADARSAQPNVRVCQNFTCGLPIRDMAELKAALK